MPIKQTDTEDKVKQEVKKLLNAFDSDLYWFMPAANGFGRVGIPDFIACLLGDFVAIECKRPSNADGLTALQARERDKISDAMGNWFLVYNDETLEALRRSLLDLQIENVRRRLEQ